MAWIESHQSLKDSHKLYDLMASMEWEIHEAVGRLQLFWWWCVDHAEDGDLTKFKPHHLAIAAGLSPTEGKKFLEGMIEAGFIDLEPGFRLHDWWDYFGTFLRKRYSKRPEVWQRVRDLYQKEPPKEDGRSNPWGTEGDSPREPEGVLLPPPRGDGSRPQPDLTKPDLTKPREETPKPPEGAGGASPPRSSAFHRFKAQSQEVLEYLNAKAGRNFRLIEAHMKPIARRLDEPGITIDGIKEMIDSKVKAWKGDSKMDQYLRPETLFKTEKFQTYYDTRTVDQPRGPNGNDNRTGTFSRNVGTYNDKPEKLAQVAEYERRLKEQAKAKAVV